VIRRRLTIPRAGFTVWRRSGAGRFATYVFAEALSAASVWMLRHAPEDMRWLVAGVGAICAIMCSMVSGRSGLQRFTASAIPLAAAGVAIPLAGAEFSQGMARLWAIAAVTLLVSGVALSGFLHAAPRAEG